MAIAQFPELDIDHTVPLPNAALIIGGFGAARCRRHGGRADASGVYVLRLLDVVAPRVYQ